MPDASYSLNQFSGSGPSGIVVDYCGRKFSGGRWHLDTIQATVAILANQPEMGRARPELSNGLRSITTRTPYIIFYLPEESGLLIVRVLHHARDIDAEYFS